MRRTSRKYNINQREDTMTKLEALTEQGKEND